MPEERVFDVLLGTFLPDVMLMNMTFATVVLTVAEANARGFNVQEKRFPHGYKGFSLQVPFSDSVVLKSVCLPTSPKSLSSAFYSLVPAPLPVLKP